MERIARVAFPDTPNLEMLPRLPLISAEAEKLAARIERAVRRGTSDKVRELRVEVRPESIILHGRCGTFYCKQLAQHSAMALSLAVPLVNQIEVW